MADSSFGKTSAVRSIRAAFTQVFPFRPRSVSPARLNPPAAAIFAR
jgi:hypothetical protein